MGPLRKIFFGEESNQETDRFPPEAYKYDSELTPELINRLKKKADKVLGGQKGTVVDSYDGKQRT